MAEVLLPDCRARQSRAVSRGGQGMWRPVFCANCGTDGGLVPEEGVTFLFYLCNACAETYGAIAGTMLMPDEVFFETLRQVQLEEHGHYLTPAEWQVVGEDPTHPLWTILRDRPQ